MILTIDLGQWLTNLASIIAIIGGVYGFARYLKRWWNRPAGPAE